MLSRERFDQIVKEYTPRGWVVVHIMDTGQDCVGCADGETKRIHIPCRVSVEVLLIFLHEVAHIKLRHLQKIHTTEWHDEYCAERWAYFAARRERVEVSTYRLGVLQAYVRRRYKRHLNICRLYGTAPRLATRSELKWMELDG